MKLIAIVLLAAGLSAQAAEKNVTYFSCVVKEELGDVSVKFAVKDLNTARGTGELVYYPGTNEDDGAILVSPTEIGGRYTIMSNLNAQGGDLSVTRGGDIFLFGDGDGYQYTDFVLWDDGDEERAHREGYVRDYGSAYSSGDETFKQFIKCEKSDKVL